MIVDYDAATVESIRAWGLGVGKAAVSTLPVREHEDFKRHAVFGSLLVRHESSTT